MKDAEPVIKFLSQLGLDFFESKVFMNLLEKGPLTVLALSRESDVSRTNVYRIIERLKSWGLVDERTEGSKKMIYATSVQKLELLVQEQENKSIILRKTLPEIKSLYEGVEEAPEVIGIPGTTVRLLKDTEESLAELNFVLENSKEIKAILPYDYSELFNEEISNTFRRTVQKDKTAYYEILLESYTKRSSLEDLVLFNLSKTFKSKVFEYDFGSGHIILIIEDRVITLYKEDDVTYGFVIENENDVIFHENIFKLIWESSKDI